MICSIFFIFEKEVGTISALKVILAILISLCMTILIIILNSTLVFTLGESHKITDLAIPFIEEFGRLTSIFGGPPLIYIYTTIFALSENVVLLSFDLSNVHIIHLVIMRTIVFSLHFFLLWVQYRWYKQYKKTNQKYKIFIGFMLAYALHVSWNVIISHDVYSLVSSL